MKKRNLICIVCPVGCQLEVQLEDDGAVKCVLGNTCKRGEGYAINECTHPVRTLTSTMRVEKGAESLVSVKSSKPLPKELIFACMEIINRNQIKAPIHIGEVLIPNIGNTGIDIIATKNVKGINEKKNITVYAKEIKRKRA